MSGADIHGSMTMREILTAHPHAGRVLLRKYRLVSGSLSDPLEKVVREHGGIELAGLLDEIREAGALQARLQITPLELRASLDAGEDWRLLDVRSPAEVQIVRLEGSVLLDSHRSREILDTWPKQTPLLFYCHKGIRSLEAALHFHAAGFERVRNLTGGIDLWAIDVDPSLPRY